MAKRDINISVLRAAVNYCPLTGSMTFNAVPASAMESGIRSAQSRANLRNGMLAGKPAFAGLNDNGYLRGGFLGHMLYAHRVAWAITHGEWPHSIDHINGDKTDNRIANLRAVTQAQNSRNMRMRDSNSSGHVGVRWSKPSQKWAARVTVNGKEIHLGLFLTFEDAVAARKRADRQYGFHPNHGRVPSALKKAA